MATLRFLPINLDKDAALCIKFRIDSFVSSFGNAESFYPTRRKTRSFRSGM
jgi:hypothetical protein